MNECKGCKLYSHLCLIVTLDDPKKCPCISCLVKPTCVAKSQTCDKYEEIINRIKQEHRLAGIYDYERK